MTLSTLIIDPETEDRERLRSYLAEEPEVRVVGSCREGTEAIDRIRALRPDLIFLDLRLRGFDAFSLLEDLKGFQVPAVIFTTESSNHAHRAFEVAAVDYLIKPIERRRLGQAVRRAHQRLQAATSPAETSHDNGYAERLAVRSPGNVSFLRVEDVDWVEADGNYVRLHSGGTVHRMRQTLTAVESYLDPDRFVRIHRSALVNAQRIESLRILPQGEHAVTLSCGRELQTNRGCRNRLLEVLRAFG